MALNWVICVGQVLPVPYSTSFDSPGDTLNWSHYAISGTDDWVMGHKTGFSDTSAHSQPFVWQTHDDYLMAGNSDRALQTPWFDLTDTIAEMILSFWQERQGWSNTVTWQLEYRTGSGLWNLLDNPQADKGEWQDGGGFFANLAQFHRSGISLRFLQGPGADSVQFRFHLINQYVSGPGWAIDDFSIQPAQYDVIASRGDTIHDLHPHFTMFHAKSDYGFINEFYNSFTLDNKFYLSEDTILDDGDVFLTQKAINVAFDRPDWKNTIAMPAGLHRGTYYLLYSLNTNSPFWEANVLNNVSYCVMILDTLMGSDYADSFDHPEQYWNTTLPGSQSQWKHGNHIDWGWSSVHSGNTVWYPDPIVPGGLNQSEFLVSPYLDLSNSVNTSLCLWFSERKSYIGQGPSLRLMPHFPILTDTSATYNLSGGQLPWPALGGWECFCKDLSDYDGNPSTKIIFSDVGGSNVISLLGSMIDDIYIGARKCDISVEGGLSDRFTLSSRNIDTLYLEICNSGLQPSPSSQMDLFWSTDSVLDVNDQSLGAYSLPEIADTTRVLLSFTYAKPTDLPGQYWIITDIDPQNNVSEMREYNNRNAIRVYQYAPTPLPYANDFETVVDGWRHEATLGADEWNWAVPQGHIINSAFSGVKAWVTNDTGEVSHDSRMHLYTPVFDLSQLLHPVIEFDMWNWFWGVNGYNSWPYDGGTIDYSSDGGANWRPLRPTNPSYTRWTSPLAYDNNGETDWPIPQEPYPYHECTIFEPRLERSFLNSTVFQGRDYDEVHHFSMDLEALSQQSSVQFKFSYANVNSHMEGMLMDDFKVVEGAADLRMAYQEALWADPADTKVCFNFDIKNDGNLVANALDVQFYLSSDTVFDAGDVPLSIAHIDQVRPKAKAHRTMRVDAPVDYGNYEYLLYRIDAANAVPEADEANNNGYWPLKMEDDLPIPYSNDFSDDVIDGWSWFLDTTSAYQNYLGVRFRHRTVVGEDLPDSMNGQWFMDLINLGGLSIPFAELPTWYLCTPAFDLSNVGDIHLSFDMRCSGVYSPDANEGGNLQFSIDGGTSWQVLTADLDPNAQNWYESYPIASLNDEPGWSGLELVPLHRSINISWLSGNADVRFRWQYRSGFTPCGACTQGLCLDNFSLNGDPLILQVPNAQSNAHPAVTGDWNVYPVPTATNVNIEYPQEWASRPMIELLGMDSRRYDASYSFQQGGVSVDLSKLAAGIYIIRMIGSRDTRDVIAVKR